MVSMIPAALRGPGMKDLEKIRAIIRAKFPGVVQVSTQELASWIQSRETPLLIDTRKPEEFAVSHLRGAVNLESPGAIAKYLAERKPGRAILYCSVGYRSSRLADQLQRRGIQDIANLEGSIFAWANEGRPVFQGEREVRQVHPYNARWAGLLRPELVPGTSSPAAG